MKVPSNEDNSFIVKMDDRSLSCKDLLQKPGVWIALTAAAEASLPSPSDLSNFTVTLTRSPDQGIYVCSYVSWITAPLVPTTLEHAPSQWGSNNPTNSCNRIRIFETNIDSPAREVHFAVRIFSYATGKSDANGPSLSGLPYAMEFELPRSPLGMLAQTTTQLRGAQVSAGVLGKHMPFTAVDMEKTKFVRSFQSPRTEAQVSLKNAEDES